MIMQSKENAGNMQFGECLGVGPSGDRSLETVG